MRLEALGQLVGQNLRRNLRHDLFSVLGVLLGVAALTFFLALDGGVRSVLLGEIFPVDRIEVVAPRTSLIGTGRILDDEMVGRLQDPPAATRARPKAVYARLLLSFPARGWGGGKLLGRGRDVFFEVSGFCDGVDPAVLKDDVRTPHAFEDWEAVAEEAIPCGVGDSCPKGRYCAKDLNRCQRPVPVVVSRQILEIYNTTIAPSHPGMPRISEALVQVALGQRFAVELGRSHLGSRATRGGAPIERQFELVGISDKAMPIGMTVPLGYVRRWNQRYAGEAEATRYSSVVAILEDKRDVTAFSSYAKGLGLEIKGREAERVGLFITLGTALFTLISLVIIGLSATNIMHTFLMLVAERKREIGVLRAVGASRRDIRAVILGEALVIGALGGTVGVLLAAVAARLCDWLSATRLPDFPFKPESYFVFSPSLIAGAIGFAMLFCLLGALLPAQRAAKLNPAAALTAS